LAKLVQDALSAKFGPGDWIEANSGTSMVLRRATAESYGLNWEDVQETARAAARKMPHIARVYTDSDFDQTSDYDDDEITFAMRLSYLHGRSPDLMILPEPCYTFAAAEASHGTPYEYDTHVPVIFLGSGIRPGHYAGRIAPNDIAPTLSHLIGVPVPGSSVGRVLREMLLSPR
jgi:hypothetical protein